MQTTQKRETRIFEGQNCVRLRLDKAAKSTYKSHSVCDKRDKVRTMFAVCAEFV